MIFGRFKYYISRIYSHMLKVKKLRELNEKDNTVAISKSDDPSINNNIICIDDTLNVKNKLKEGKIAEIMEPDKFEVFPDMTKEREVFYIAGQSGSGKSFIARQITDNILDIRPGYEVYIFSKIKNDDAFKDLNAIEMPLDKLDDIDVLGSFKNCIMLFDDIDSTEKKIRTNVYKIIDQALECGRHNNIYCVITNHLINPADKNYGRIIMSEMDRLIFFPKSGNRYQIDYVCTKYIGLPRKKVAEICKLPSRWVCIKKSYPSCLISERRVEIL